MESIQLKTGQALINSVMIYAVIAWRILYLTHLGRQCPDIPCGGVFEEAERKSACAVVKRSKEAGEPTLSEFIAIVGKLGGHLGRKAMVLRVRNPFGRAWRGSGILPVPGMRFTKSEASPAG
ncbi:MAG: IS4 family transposase [Verrucomicrobia bacterium]|nr:IS4 family transposase [Verrucomicrobiota bacterium]